MPTESIMNEFDYVRRNYLSLKEEISALSERLGYKEPTLAAVTKSGTDEELIALAMAGASDIAENRPQELKRRYELLKERALTPRMHEIGSLQTNKVKMISDFVYLVHSLDSERLAREIDKRASALGKRIPVLIEINSASEEQKGGILPENAESFAEKLREFGALSLRGVMTMGPLSESGESLRPYFRETKKIFDKLTPYFEPGEEWVLSMGMSDSYRVAIEEGSTLIRVGRRLFTK